MERAPEEEFCRSGSAAVDFVRPMHCLSMRGTRRNLCKSRSELRMLHLSCPRCWCLHFPEASYRTNVFSGLTFGVKRPFQRPSSIGRVPDGASLLSLDGLLVNAAAEGRRESLERRQLANLESFPSLARMLMTIVIVAAASAATKKEINRLQLAVDNRDKESALLQRKMEDILEQLSFWKERARNLCEEARSHFMKPAESLGSNDRVLARKRFVSEESTPKCDSRLLEQLETPVIGEGVRKTVASIGASKEQSCDRLDTTETQDIVFVQREGKAGFSRGSYFHDEEKQHGKNRYEYADQKADFVSDCSSFVQDNFEAFTPCAPFTELKRMFTPNASLDRAPTKQGGPCCQNVGRGVNTGPDLMTQYNTPCAAMALQIKNQLQHIHREASAVIAALTSVIQKAHVVEMVNSSALLNQPLNNCSHAAVKDLKKSIEQAAAQLTCLEQVVWNSLRGLETEPEAPNVSLTDQDTSFVKLIEPALTSFTQARKQCIDRDVEAHIMTDEFLWRRTDAEERRLSGMSDWSIDTSTSDLSCTEQHQGLGSNVVSAIQCVVKKTVDDFMAPLDERSQVAGVESCPEMVVEQLLSGLENAAAKVAKMEMQMKILRDSINVSERKRKQAERNLAKVQRNSVNQDACRAKDETIARLQEEVCELQAKISDLTIKTPHDARQASQFSKPTLVASNLLFNLDSPSPQDPHRNSMWKGLNELPRFSDSLDRGRSQGNTGATYQSETYTCPSWSNELNEESGCIPPDKLKQSIRASPKEETGNGIIRFILPEVATSHARKLRFSSVDARSDKKRNSSSEGLHRVGRKEGNLRTGVNVLAGVEINTPIRARKFGSKDREHRNLSSSADNINRAKENFSKRRRWM